MLQVSNLAAEIKKQLPQELVEFLLLGGEMAQRRGQKLYLVGGVVRDLLLGRPNFDLDLVVEGDAIALARELAAERPSKLTVHQRFGTAKLRWNGWSADIATARFETYAKACALPAVSPGTINEDLFRRDFTINAMATELNPGSYGQLLDLYGGLADLEKKAIRVLHDGSFVDDATRIWRAVRYEQRLDFRIEPKTLGLLQRNVKYLHKISGDRLRHELELVCKEACPEKALRRAGELGALRQLHPKLTADAWLSAKYERARQHTSPDDPSFGLYLALVTYRLDTGDLEELVSRLNLRKSTAVTLCDTIYIKANLRQIAGPDITPAHVYWQLAGYAVEAVVANLIAADLPEAVRRLTQFIETWRYVRPALNGEDLKKLGVAWGPEIKAMLQRLLEARLEGQAENRRDEKALVKSWLAGKGS